MTGSREGMIFGAIHTPLKPIDATPAQWFRKDTKQKQKLFLNADALCIYARWKSLEKTGDLVKSTDANS
jgi:hypothetical protein